MAFQNLFLEIIKYNDAYILKRRDRNNSMNDKFCIYFPFTEDNMEAKFDFEIDKGKIIL